MTTEQAKAALKLVLLYFTPDAWGVQQETEWCDLQQQAGIPVERVERIATSRVLCDTIQKVLGD